MPRRLITLLFFLVIFIFPPFISAAPFFYVKVFPVDTIQYAQTVIEFWLDSDSETLTATQAILNFGSDKLEGTSINIINSICTFWAPADPTLGYGNTPAPYFYNNSAVISCGFVAPGYQSTDAFGNLVARVIVEPTDYGPTTLSISNQEFRYIGSEITAGSTSDYELNIIPASQGAIPTPTPTPDPDATPTPPPSATPYPVATPTPSPLPVTTITSADLNFYDVNTTTGVTSTGITGTGLAGSGIFATGSLTSSTATNVIQDNTIPPPPDSLELRPKATPYLISILQGDTTQESGDVLAAQSLRELLIPGKSQADKTVVMVNLISTLTFITLLAIVIWRLITISRLNKLKTAHMKELLTSELAAIESKIGAVEDSGAQSSLRKDLTQAVEKLTGDEEKSQ